MKSLPLLSNHPRVRRWTAAVVASAVALGVCLASYDNVDAAIKQNRIERLNARIENVYTADYQDMADDKLEQEKSKSSATEDETATRISPVTPTSNRNTAKPMNSSYSALFPARRTPSPSR